MARRRRADGAPRRRFLLQAGAGGAFLLGAGVAARGTRAFSAIDSPRRSSVGVAGAGNGIVGVVDQGSVKKNTRAPMVELRNHAAETLTVTVSLDTCSEGTLYDNAGGSGCSVTFSLASGNSRYVDIDASVTGTITYTIGVTGSGFALDTAGSVLAETGSVASAVLVQAPTKDQDFTAAPPQGQQGNVFEVKNVDVRDNDNDDDVVQVEYVVREGGGSGSVVAQQSVSFAPTARYHPQGNPAVTVQPDSGYTIQAGTLYSLTVTGTDVDGNFSSSTVEDTA